MLSRLYIRNYAIIREVEVSFDKGLNIITGETGAGKSILVGALGLILGSRADSAALLDTSSKCLVEGTFRHPEHASVQAFFTEHELDSDKEIILRREISPAGKSRAFINDTPVNLSHLQQLAGLLVDLHQQFDTLDLGQNSFQLDMLDALAGQLPLRKTFTGVWHRYRAAQQQWERLEAEKIREQKEFDYYQFLFQELEEAAFKPGEMEELETEQQLLEHAGQVTLALQRVYMTLDADEQPVTQLLRSLSQQLDAVSPFHSGIPSLVERLRSSQIELKDIAEESERIASGVNMDEKRRVDVADRLSIGYKLFKKHQVSGTGALLQIQDQLSERLRKVASLDADSARILADAERLRNEAEQLASSLSEGRKKLIPGFEQRVHQLLERVGMPNARIRIRVEPEPLSVWGTDAVDFLFDANKSGRFEPLRKVASGGEFSRLLLCIKTLIGGSLAMPVMIFDEIDSGISGEAARQVGILMKEMGRAHQVISITHQPQIAARADAHFYVYKQETADGIRTQLRRLEAAERVDSIARMMSGENPSATALNNARELIAAS